MHLHYSYSRTTTTTTSQSPPPTYQSSGNSGMTGKLTMAAVSFSFLQQFVVLCTAADATRMFLVAPTATVYGDLAAYPGNQRMPRLTDPTARPEQSQVNFTGMDNSSSTTQSPHSSTETPYSRTNKAIMLPRADPQAANMSNVRNTLKVTGQMSSMEGRPTTASVSGNLHSSATVRIPPSHTHQLLTM